MKIVTIDQFLKFNPCYSEERIRAIAGDKNEWTALEVLALDNVPAADRLWAVLREEAIDATILHEFACRCAEQALSLISNPDQRSIDAIAAKRAWLRGEITDEQLDAAAQDAAQDAAWAAAQDAVRTAARVASWAAARDMARDAQVIVLREMLIEAQEGAEQ